MTQLIGIEDSSFCGESFPFEIQSRTLAGQFSVEGISLPLADKWVLLPTEQADVAAATLAFNSIIENAASQAGLAFLDANSLMTSLYTTGISSNNFYLSIIWVLVVVSA